MLSNSHYPHQDGDFMSIFEKLSLPPREEPREGNLLNDTVDRSCQQPGVMFYFCVVANALTLTQW